MATEDNKQKLTEKAVAGVKALQPYQPGKPIEELERELGISDIVKLASNENPSGPSPKALAAIEAVSKDLTRYPDGAGFGLKEALCERYSISADMITLGNGSNDILEFVTRAFVNPGEEVIFSRHAFAVYPLATLAVGGRPVETPALNWGNNLEAMLDAVSERSKVIFIANFFT